MEFDKIFGIIQVAFVTLVSQELFKSDNKSITANYLWRLWWSIIILFSITLYFFEDQYSIFFMTYISPMITLAPITLYILKRTRKKDID